MLALTPTFNQHLPNLVSVTLGSAAYCGPLEPAVGVAAGCMDDSMDAE